MSDMPDEPDILSPERTGDWLPPSEAASRLGVSERTLWRRVDAGRLNKRLVRGRAEILIPRSETDGAPETDLAVPDAPDHPARGDSELMLAILGELREQRGSDGQTIVRLAERVGQLQAENEALTARLAHLEARERQSWWRRWLGLADRPGTDPAPR